MEDFKCPKCGEAVGFKATACHTPLCSIDLSKLGGGMAAAVRNSRTGQIIEITDTKGNGRWLSAETLEDKGPWYGLGGSLYCLFVIGCRVQQWVFNKKGQPELITVQGFQFNRALHEKALSRRRVTINEVLETL